MGLLTAGYWSTTYWPEDYFIDDYWPDYGAVVYEGITQTLSDSGIISQTNTDSGIISQTLEVS